MFSRSIEAEAKVDAGGRPRGKLVYPTGTGILSSTYLSDRPSLGHPHLSPSADLVSLPTPRHRLRYPRLGPAIFWAPAHQATGFPSKLQLRSSGLNMAGKMVREALADTMGRPLPRVDVGVNRTKTPREPGHRKLMSKPQEPGVHCTLSQPQPC